MNLFGFITVATRTRSEICEIIGNHDAVRSMASHLMGVSINIDRHRIGSRAVSRAIINFEAEIRICRTAGICRRRKSEAPAI